MTNNAVKPQRIFTWFSFRNGGGEQFFEATDLFLPVTETITYTTLHTLESSAHFVLRPRCTTPHAAAAAGFAVLLLL